MRTDPRAGWSVNALFDMQARAGDWEGALATLAVARKHGNVEAEVALRRRAVLLTAEARDLDRRSPTRRWRSLTKPCGFQSLIPAAEIAGRLLASKGETRLASRLVARTWKLAPHPDLATVYAFAKPGRSPRERPSGSSILRASRQAISRERSPLRSPPSRRATGRRRKPRSRPICTTGRQRDLRSDGAGRSRRRQ